MFYIIGTGLNILDIPYSAVECIKSCDIIYLECYTSISPDSKEKLEAILQKQIKIVFRNFVEDGHEIIENLKMNCSIAFLVVGTPFFATTHLDLLSRVKAVGEYRIIHNASIQNCTGILGLSAYSFGQTISIPRFSKNYPLISLYDKFKVNRTNGLHTLFLLDIKTDEQYFMEPIEALELLICLEERTNYNILSTEDKVFVISQFGTKHEKILYEKISALFKMEFSSPLYSLVIPGKLCTFEEDLIKYFY